MPEWNVWKSTADWRNARRQLRKLYMGCPHTESTVSLAHMLFADMGGFTIEYSPENHALGSRRDVQETDGPPPCPLMASAGSDGNEEDFAVIGEPLQAGPLFPGSPHDQTALRNAPESERARQALWHLSARTLRKLISDDHISSDLPSAEQIMDE